MGAMLGVVLADNLNLLMQFWASTSLSSFLLIGYWHHRQDARRRARMAYAITGVGAPAGESRAEERSGCQVCANPR